MNNPITVTATINADSKKVWDFYTNPEHITQWNFADPSWHCPKATNDLKVGGKYFARMEAKDGSYGFDFEAIYDDINMGKRFSYLFGDRQATVEFEASGATTEIRITLDPENEKFIRITKRRLAGHTQQFQKLYRIILISN